MAEEKKQEQQVIETIVEEEYVENPHKWTFLKYVKSIAHFKWWVIGLTLFGAVVGFLGFKFLLNPYTKKLSADYTYNLAGQYVDDDTIRFIDGTLFNPYDLTSRENLQKIKDSDAKFASINLDKIIDKGGIKITKNVLYYNETDTSNIAINYSIEAKATFFQNDQLGKDFVYEIINYGKQLSTVAIDNFSSELEFVSGFDDLTFDRQIQQLSNQYNKTVSLYNSLMNSFGSAAAGNSDGTKLFEISNTFQSKYYVSGVTSFIDDLKGDKDAHKYVNYTVGKENEKIEEIHTLCGSYIETIKNNKKLITIYEDRLDKLLASTSIIGSDTNVSSQITEYNSTITSLKIYNSDLDKELNNCGYSLNGAGEYVFDPLNENTTIYKLNEKNENWVKNNAKFKERINSYKALLIDDNDSITSTCKYCYANYQNKINILNSGYVLLKGDVSNIIGAGVGLIVGFIITSLITATIYVYRPSKKEDKQ